MAPSALLTDLYEITMLAGYFEQGMHQEPATFDLFFRESPFQGGYAVMAGLDPALDYLASLRFTEDDLEYLESLNLFRGAFIAYLSAFRFKGRVVAAPEGTAVFPLEPILSVEGSVAEAQFVESALLNTINFQTLIATKASRVVRAAAPGKVVEFGLRRAQGSDGAISAARAAAVGGVLTTSNLAAGKAYGLAVSGTQAHSWIMAFPDELAAFRAYAMSFPDACVLLVDTYDTLKSGIPNAITVAGELEREGHALVGVRLDSGDLAYLSREARRMLDEAGLSDVRIMASNELDEQVIESIRAGGGRVDVYGVGTRLTTAAGPGGGALGGIYKMVQIGDTPKLKVSSDPAKCTIPGRKRLWRAVRQDGGFEMDVIALEGERLAPGAEVFDPTQPLRHAPIPEGVRIEDIRTAAMERGMRTCRPTALPAIAERAAEQLSRLPEGTLRFINPHRYRVGLSRELHELRIRLIEEVRA